MADERAFSPEGYRMLLTALRDRGYVVRGFADAEPDQPHLIVRHDVDLTLEAAVRLAEIEADMGVAAVYYVLLRSELYSPFTPRAEAALKRLLDLGHAVGLHLDASLYDADDAQALDRAAERECRILEDLMGAAVETISFHRPAPALLGYEKPLAGRLHAYMPRFFSDMGYCSDSQGRWRFGHPLDHEAVAAGRALQLLTHPVWWIAGDLTTDPMAALDAFLDEHKTRMRAEVMAQITPYAERAGETPKPDRKAAQKAGEARMAILGDSRAFDTYYLNPSYGATGYGYQRTFPALLRKGLLTMSGGRADAVHIPDHFRGSTMENNIIRLGLTDPAVVVLLDGIWESLLNKEHFIAWVAEQVRNHDWKDGAPLDLSFSSSRLVDLFEASELPESPHSYGKRQRRLISHFVRRRRAVVWLTLPVPPRDHLGGLHYAGNYMTIPDWGRVLRALNAEMMDVCARYGAQVLDLHALMEESGGADACLLDQWHFTPAFHGHIAERLGRLCAGLLQAAPPAGALSSRFMLQRPLDDTPVTLCGAADLRDAWMTNHPDAVIAGTVDTPEALGADARLIVLFDDDADRREALAMTALKQANAEAIVVYAEELAPLVNPAGNDRARHGGLT